MLENNNRFFLADILGLRKLESKNDLANILDSHDNFIKYFHQPYFVSMDEVFNSSSYIFEGDDIFLNDAIDFIENGINYLYISGRCKFNDKVYEVVSSFVEDYKVFLFIKDVETSSIFCLIQNHSNLAIWYPLKNIYISLYAHNDLIHQHVIPKFISRMLRKVKNLKGSVFDNPPSPKILLSYPRPFHFFVDLLPSYFSIKNELYLNESNVIYLRESSFFILGEICDNIYETESQLNDFINNNNFYTIKPVRNLINKKYNDLHYPEWVVEKSIGSVEKNIILNIDQSQFILWLSVCNEKRSWAESNVGIRKIIEAFSARKSSIFIILDGMTSPELEVKKDFVCNSALTEFELANCIIKDYPNIQFLNAVGYNSKEKIELANRASFFIANFLTDSMYVARFCSKPGVGYGANKADYKTHRHPQTFIFPSEYVSDLEDDIEENWSKTGFSIDPEDLIGFALSVENLYENRPPIDKVFDGKYFSLSESGDSTYVIKSLSNKDTYVSIYEEMYSFSEARATAYTVEKGENYYFRYEANSIKNSQLIIIGYSNNKRCFTERINPNGSKSFVFPDCVDQFRLIIKLVKNDIIFLSNIFWNTSKSANCIWHSK